MTIICLTIEDGDPPSFFALNELSTPTIKKKLSTAAENNQMLGLTF